MQYEKSVLLKNNKECCIRNAVGDDAQEVLDIFLLTHEQTDFWRPTGMRQLLIQRLKGSFWRTESAQTEMFISALS